MKKLCKYINCPQITQFITNVFIIELHKFDELKNLSFSCNSRNSMIIFFDD